jgi:hypothetical protein
MIVKVDRTSVGFFGMSCSFLNKEIWNFTSQLPEDFFNKRVG